MAEADDKTEAPTAKKRQDARDAGQVALSKEMVTLAGLMTGTVLLANLGGHASASMALKLRGLLTMRMGLQTALASAAGAAAWVVLPLAGAVCIVAVSAVLAQTGLLLRLEALQPDLTRLNPMRGLGRVFGRQNLVEAGKASLKLAVLATAAWWGVRRSVADWSGASGTDPGVLASVLSTALVHVAVPVIGTQMLLAMADYGIVRFRLTRSLRMSREEVRDEARQSDGDPRVKARLRKIRAQRARTRMMTKVPKATVVVTNPTHYAVALQFDRARQAAPRVVAKGADEVAARIREMAQAHGVPLIANPPLARALFRMELDAEIPAEHFQAVAEIIAYVWRLRGRVAG